MRARLRVIYHRVLVLRCALSVCVCQGVQLSVLEELSAAGNAKATKVLSHPKSIACKVRLNCG